MQSRLIPAANSHFRYVMAAAPNSGRNTLDGEVSTGHPNEDKCDTVPSFLLFWNTHGQCTICEIRLNRETALRLNGPV